jgi:Fur family transcriptional regulator, peroxide stress response regulator
MSRRQTRQLAVVWDAVKDETSHPTADQIYEKVREELPNISLGTVYRNLQKLAADGKLQVVNIDRRQHFDPIVDRHQHFICERCSRVYDIFLEQNDEPGIFLLPESGFTVTSHQLSLYGTCKDCSQSD